MKKKYVVLAIVLCLTLILGLVFGPKLYRAGKVWGMLDGFLSPKERSLDVTVSVEGNEDMTFRLDWQQVNEKRVCCLESGGVAVYYCDGVIYLENGKGYDFGDAIPDLSALLEKPWLLYPLVQIDHEGGTWAVNLNTAKAIPQLYGLSLVLEEGDDGAQVVQCFGWKDQNGGYFGIRAAKRQDREILSVPQEVVESIASGAVQGDKDLTEDVLRLMKGWADLSSREVLGMELELSADCGPLELADTLSVRRNNQTGISFVEKNGYGLYFFGEKVCTADGTVLAAGGSSVEAVQLLGVAYYLCLNGDLICEGDVYSLTLDQEGMEAIASAIVPEAENFNVAFESGYLRLQMNGDTIESIKLYCGGSVDLLLTQVGASVGAELRVMDGDLAFAVPQEVLDALSQ